MMCSRCKVRKAAVAGALCLFCLHWPADVSPQHHHPHSQPAAVISAPPADRPEPPHPPEIDGTQPAPGVAADVQPLYFRLGHPVLGQLGGIGVLAPPRAAG
jgi:hypothetical protein